MCRRCSWHTPKGGPNDGGAPLSPSASPRRLEERLSAAAVDATSGLLADVRDEARRVDANTRTIIEGPRDEIQVQLLREQRKIAEANTRARVRERAIVAVVAIEEETAGNAHKFLERLQKKEKLAAMLQAIDAESLAV